MDSFQFLQLLKDEFQDFYFENPEGKCKSTLGALELIEMFKKQIQNESIKEFIAEYSDWVPDHEAKCIAQDLITRRHERSSELQPSINFKHPLVICK